jgi:hypothetical protein
MNRLPQFIGVLAFLVLAAGMVYFVGAAGVLKAQSAPPQPALSSPSWQLDFTSDKPMRFVMTWASDNQLHIFWLIHYTVTNNTGEDLFFDPIIELRTDNGKILQTVAAIDPNMFDKLKQITGDPLLTNPMMMPGRILQGDDNARSSVALFTDIPDEARGFDVFVAGLSGETATQADPLTHQVVVLRKTLDLKYWTPGQAINISPNPQLISKDWVMR